MILKVKYKETIKMSLSLRKEKEWANLIQVTLNIITGRR